MSCAGSGLWDWKQRGGTDFGFVLAHPHANLASNVFSFPSIKRIILDQQRARCLVSHTTTILVAGIAAIIGGIVGGATTSWMRSDAQKPTASVRRELPDYDDLSIRIDALESQVGRLAQQRLAPAAIPMPAQTAPTD